MDQAEDGHSFRGNVQKYTYVFGSKTIRLLGTQNVTFWCVATPRPCADGADMDVAIVDVPSLTVRIVGAAAGEMGRHAR
jgi:hypothetical protein